MPIIKVFANDVRKSTTSRHRLAKLVMIVAGLLFGCLVAEVALRVVGYSYPIFFETDAERGYALIPNVEGWSWAEQKSYVKINSDGFRDTEHTKEKPANTIRIAVLGDSFTEARAVAPESSFPSVIERELRRSGKNVEVMNFGVTGYGTVEELLTLRQRVWQYSPDIVVLAVCTYNDITDNYRVFKNADEAPYFLLTDSGLVFDDSFRRSKKYRWNDSFWYKGWTSFHNSSRLVQLIHHAQFAARTRLSEWKAAERAVGTPTTSVEKPPTPTTAALSDVVGIQNMTYREPGDADWNNAWAVTEALITEMGKECDQHRASFLITTVTGDIQVYPDVGVRQAMMDKLGVKDLFYPDRRLQLMAEREGIAFLDLSVPMQQAADRDHIYFHGFGKAIGNGHWNERGHEFAGHLIASRLGDWISQ